MLNLNIQNETSRLRAVVLGTAYHNGPSPSLEQCYDPKSKMHVKAGTYPSEHDMIIEMQSLANVFNKYNVSVFRPKIIENYNQIFSRDIGFVIDDKFVKANILPDRDQEIDAIDHVISKIVPQKIIKLPEKVFDDATVETVIIEYQKNESTEICKTIAYLKDDKISKINNKITAINAYPP